MPHARSSALVMLLGGSLIAAPVMGQSILYVDDSAPARGDGLSWPTAANFLQDAIAIAAAPGSTVMEIRIAGGTHRPDESEANPSGSGVRDDTFVLPSGVALRGGYAGFGEPDPDYRSIGDYPTTLSADLAEDDPVNRGENAYHVVTVEDADADTVLDGVTIVGGYAPQSSGSGFFIISGTPTILNCIVEDNFATSGAGALVIAGHPTFSGCTFDGNYAWGGRGGAIYGETGSDITVMDCEFTYNTAQGTGGVGDGGAVFLTFGCPASFVRCTFIGNTAFTSNQLYPTGGAVSLLADDVSFESCAFVANDARVGGPGGAGGAIWNGGDGLSLINCLFSDNKAAAGGAMVTMLSSPVLTNCTLVANSADDGGGLFSIYDSHAVLTNCILWGNTAVDTTLYKAQIHNGSEDSDVALTYSCVEGLFITEDGEDPPDPEDFPGCIDDDPMFADINSSDLHLSAGSPCIDAGDNDMVPAWVEADLDGNDRFVDDPDTADSGNGTAPIVDMGAYEYAPSGGVSGDLDGDGIVGTTDLLILLGAWGTCGDCDDCPADLDGECVVGTNDLIILLGNWG